MRKICLHQVLGGDWQLVTYESGHIGANSIGDLSGKGKGKEIE